MNSAYILTCVLATCCAFLARRNASETAWVWLGIAFGLLLIACLRASQTALLLDVDLRDAITDLGWYPHRRPFQIAAIGAFTLVVAAVLRSVVFSRSKLTIHVICASVAFAALVIFAAIRSSSLHWTDSLLEYRLGRSSFGLLLQACCVAVIAISALALLVQPNFRRD